MSANAIILGTVDFLRDPTNGLGLTASECDEQPDGQPPPSMGQLYYAVSEGEWTCDTTEYLGESYGIEVTITVRAGVAPADRYGVMLKRTLRDLAAKVRAAIHGNDLLRLAANKHIENDSVTVNGFVEPLRFKSAARIQVRGQDWFWAEGYEGSSPPSGLSITLTFGQAIRDQGIDSTMS